MQFQNKEASTKYVQNKIGFCWGNLEQKLKLRLISYPLNVESPAPTEIVF